MTGTEVYARLPVCDVRIGPMAPVAELSELRVLILQYPRDTDSGCQGVDERLLRRRVQAHLSQGTDSGHMLDMEETAAQVETVLRVPVLLAQVDTSALCGRALQR